MTIAKLRALLRDSTDSLRDAIRLGYKINRRRHARASAEHARKHGRLLRPLLRLSVDEVEDVIERSILIYCLLYEDAPMSTVRGVARACFLDRPWWPDDSPDSWVANLRVMVRSGCAAPRLALALLLCVG